MDNNRKKRNQMLAQKVMKGLESRGDGRLLCGDERGSA